MPPFCRFFTVGEEKRKLYANLAISPLTNLRAGPTRRVAGYPFRRGGRIGGEVEDGIDTTAGLLECLDILKPPLQNAPELLQFREISGFFGVRQQRKPVALVGLFGEARSYAPRSTGHQNGPPPITGIRGGWRMFEACEHDKNDAKSRWKWQGSSRTGWRILGRYRVSRPRHGHRARRGRLRGRGFAILCRVRVLARVPLVRVRPGATPARAAPDANRRRIDRGL